MRALRLVRTSQMSRNVRYVQRLRDRAQQLFPQSQSLAEKWVSAKLTLGHVQPKVRIGCERNITFPRTLREAGIPGAIE